MKHCKALFLLLTFLVMFPIITSAAPTKEATYTRSQVDSIVAEVVKQIDDRLQTKVDSLTKAEVAKQVDTVLIGYKIDKAASDRLGSYIAESNKLQAEHDALVSKHLTKIGLVITLLTAIVGILVPLYFNKQNEDRLKKAEKAAKEAKASQLFAQALSEKNPLKVIDLYNHAINLKPDFSDVYISRGYLNYKMNNFYNALVDYNKAIELKPDSAEAYNNRGLLRYDEKDYNGALADYNKAIELKPDFALAYYNLGLLKYKEKDFNGALANFNKTIDLESDYADAYFNRGAMKEEMGNQKGALADYNRAIRLKPNDADIYYNRGKLKDNMNDYAGALLDYNEAIELRPNFAKAYNNRAYTLLKSMPNDNEAIHAALKDVKIAIQLDGNDYNFYETEGELYLALDQYHAAISDFAQALDLNDKDIDSYVKRAESYRKLAEEVQDTNRNTELIAKAVADEDMAKKLKEEGK